MADQSQNDQPSTFTPIHPFKMDDPRSWGRAIGMMDWDNDKIVFSKRSLLEFLKSMQVTVNTNFSEVQKLPKYASFGKLSKQATEAAVADLVEAEINDPTTDSTAHPSKSTVPRGTGSAGLKPSRKVVDPPGGKQSLKIYGEEYEEEDALSLAPARDGNGVDVAIEHLERVKLHVEPVVDGGAQIEDEPSEESRSSNPPPNFRPTRKVREGPGGKSTMGQALFGGYENETEEDREESRASAGKKKQQPQSGGGNLW